MPGQPDYAWQAQHRSKSIASFNDCVISLNRIPSFWGTSSDQVLQRSALLSCLLRSAVQVASSANRSIIPPVPFRQASNASAIYHRR